MYIRSTYLLGRTDYPHHHALRISTVSATADQQTCGSPSMCSCRRGRALSGKLGKAHPGPSCQACQACQHHRGPARWQAGAAHRHILTGWLVGVQASQPNARSPGRTHACMGAQSQGLPYSGTCLLEVCYSVISSLSSRASPTTPTFHRTAPHRDYLAMMMALDSCLCLEIFLGEKATDETRRETN